MIRKKAESFKVPSSKGFYWENRYSQTGEPDKHDRWARICYYNGLLISWISMINHVNYGRYYTIHDYFPSILNANPCYTNSHEDDFEKAKKLVEQRFIQFLKIVKG